MKDFAYAARLLWHARGFSAAAVLILALCTGVTTGIFSLINAVLLRPLAVTAPEELAFVYSPEPVRRPRLGSYEDVVRLAGQNELFAGAAWMTPSQVRLRLGLDVEYLFQEEVSSNYFDVLGVRPQLGRVLSSAIDDSPTADPTVVISDALWRRRFNSDPSVIGRAISVPPILGSAESARPYTIIGVMAPEFVGVASRVVSTDLWVPFARRSEESILKRSMYPVDVLVGRLKPGVTRDHVQALVSVWGSGTVLDSQRVFLPFDSTRTISPSRLGAGLMGCVIFILLIGVANLCGIVMARGVSRRSEWGIRLVLGAGRWRIARTLIAEGLILAALGGLAGLFVAHWLAVVLLNGMPTGVTGATGFVRELSLGVPIDWRVMTFSLFLVAGTGIVVGLAPLAQAWKTDLVATLGGGAGASVPLRKVVRHWILVPQVGASLALLLVAGVAVRAFIKVAVIAPGYEPDRAAVIKADLPEPLGPRMSTEKGAEIQNAYKSLFGRMLKLTEASAGIQAAALTDALPTSSSVGGSIVTREDLERGIAASSTAVANITAGYFDVVGIPLVDGRAFSPADLTGRPKVAIVDETVASRHWPGQRALGHSLAFQKGTPLVWLEVVGVVGAVKTPLSEGSPRPFVYLTAAEPSILSTVLVARGRADNARLIETLRGVVQQADPRAGIVQVRMLDSVVSDARYSRTVAAGLMSFSALMGLVLASVGLYAIVSYSVAQRRKELGIRTALGASRRDVVALVMREVARTTVLGAALGFVLGFIAIRLTSTQIMQIPALDSTTAIVAAVVIAISAFCASYVPARRASRGEPIDALRGL